jgi:molybdenum cofactor cytidylyltransferase
VSDVAALVLAAGLGTRFGGGSKLLALLEGKPLILHVAEAAIASRASPVLVVLGHDSEPVADALAHMPVTPVFNPRYREGLSTSLQAGFAALPANAKAGVVLLGDMPRISPAIIDAVIGAWREGHPLAVVPTFRGRRGNPVLLSRALAPQIAGLSGDRGAGPLLRGVPGVREHPLDEAGITLDADTPAALADIAARIGDQSRK